MFKTIKSWLEKRKNIKRIKKLIKSVKIESRKYDDLLDKICYDTDNYDLQSLIQKLKANKLEFVKFSSVTSNFHGITINNDSGFFNYGILFKNENIENDNTYYAIMSRYYNVTIPDSFRTKRKYDGTFIKQINITTKPIETKELNFRDNPVLPEDKINFKELQEEELNKLLDYFCLCSKILSSHIWDVNNKKILESKSKNQKLLISGMAAISTVVPPRSLEGGQLALADDKNQNGQLTIIKELAEK